MREIVEREVPLKAIPRATTREARFMQKVKIINECWIWIGAKDGKGIGTFRIGNHLRAPRASWELFRGKIPEGMWVVRNKALCRNKICVNPAHLFIGNKQDANKNRILHDQRGILNATAKLNEQQVMEIRRLRNRQQLSLKYIAERYDISTVTVHLIATNQSWAHLPKVVPNFSH